jgi:hypothetical protein
VATYQEYHELEEKPEKGERKVVDELIMLISDVIDAIPEKTKGIEIFKICMLELNYEKSCYNFDVQLALLKTFDKNGFLSSFTEAYETMDIKGVQLESLGYISMQHALHWGYFSQYNPVLMKYFKYLAANARDLSVAKTEAF